MQSLGRVPSYPLSRIWVKECKTWLGKRFYFLIPHPVKSLVLFILIGSLDFLSTAITTVLLKTSPITPLRTEWVGEGEMSGFFYKDFLAL